MHHATLDRPNRLNGTSQELHKGEYVAVDLDYLRWAPDGDPQVAAEAYFGSVAKAEKSTNNTPGEKLRKTAKVIVSTVASKSIQLLCSLRLIPPSLVGMMTLAAKAYMRIHYREALESRNR